MKRIKILLNIVMVGITSCSSIYQGAQDVNRQLDTTEDKCIAPVSDFAFQVRKERTSSDAMPSMPLPPEWKIQATVPDSQGKSTLELIEDRAGYNIIWVVSGNNFFLFHTNTNTWEIVNFNKEQGIVKPEMLFQYLDGQVWGIGFPFLGLQQDHLLLARFTSDKLEFEDVQNHGIASDWRVMEHPVNDRNGKFWFIAQSNSQQKSSLYSFDTTTNEIKTHLEGQMYEFGGSIAVANDNSLFILRPKEAELIQYFPQAEDLRLYELKELIEGDLAEYGYPNLLVDRKGRLWLGDYGWLEFTDEYPGWHQIIRSSIFVSENSSPHYEYVWERPTLMTETLDGRLWYAMPSSSLIWLDPEIGKWCKFTTINADIVKDQDGNLWILYEGKLYKNTISN